MGFTISEKCREQLQDLRPELDAAIRAHRQADCRLRVCDLAGNPVPDAEVRVEQTDSDFMFGCNCLWLGQLGDGNARYEELLAGLFNTVTTTFCLSDMQPEPGVWRFADTAPEVFRRPPSDRVIAFARRHGLRLKGQPLLAGSWYPQWAREQNLDENGIKDLYLDYFRRVAERYGDSFACFDLVNEAFCHTGFPLYEPEVNYVDWAFRAARALFPRSVDLFVNEAPCHCWDIPAESGENRYFNLLSRLSCNGCAPDGVGFQFHLWQTVRGMVDGEGAYSFPRLRRQLAEYAKLGMPLYVSEITVPSCLDGEVNEEAQAELIAACYRLFFAVPEMRGILQWNLCDGKAWLKEGESRGGVVDEFLRKKPAYLALEHLLRREWRTALQCRTAADGVVAFRGFTGGYTVTVTKNSQKRTFRFSTAAPDAPLVLV